MSDKVDFKKSLDTYTARRGEFRLVDVPPTRYLMIDGAGDPNTSREFAAAIETLYPVAYKVKFASSRELGRDYVVPPLEGLWWSEDMSAFTGARDKSRWSWTLLLMVPGWIDDDLVAAAVAKVAGTRPPPRLDDLRLDVLDEGLCVQTLHLGSFDDEAPVLARMHDEFVPANGLRMRGIHHEIYFSDFRKVAPDKLRTILRQPVEQLHPSSIAKL
ncbi:GyrI-like domain-containing protein [Gordonia sp. zg691]|uniref:GyrI-like domain-containing protein n=1 Tax=Gordonia jinghuaiqii TaxID=2758710 RepID=UPI0016626871|nr:GyrI-like domain-containing protein [Gordonia jinghuaiqii]MBD0862714.1 GyrI-like domain-containing protein [Gordonia jinghuaiqii]